MFHVGARKCGLTDRGGGKIHRGLLPSAGKMGGAMVRAGRCGGYRRTLKLKGCSDASRRPSAASRDLSHMSGRMTLICELEGSRAEGGSGGGILSFTATYGSCWGPNLKSVYLFPVHGHRPASMNKSFSPLWSRVQLRFFFNKCLISTDRFSFVGTQPNI